MDLILGAKGTKPGSKANARRGASTAGRSARVPDGTLHLIDRDDQSGGSSYDAVCGEPGLQGIDGEWDDDFPNEKCAVCEEAQWAASFSAMQNELLK